MKGSRVLSCVKVAAVALLTALWLLVYIVNFYVQTTLPDQLLLEAVGMMPLVGCGSCTMATGVYVCDKCTPYNITTLSHARHTADNKVAYTVVNVFPDSLSGIVIQAGRLALTRSLLSPLHLFQVLFVLCFVVGWCVSPARRTPHIANTNDTESHGSKHTQDYQATIDFVRAMASIPSAQTRITQQQQQHYHHHHDQQQQQQSTPLQTQPVQPVQPIQREQPPPPPLSTQHQPSFDSFLNDEGLVHRRPFASFSS